MDDSIYLSFLVVLFDLSFPPHLKPAGVFLCVVGLTLKQARLGVDEPASREGEYRDNQMIVPIYFSRQ